MNPYHQFLGLGDTETAPDYYRLLGVPLFTDDRKLIHSAALSRNSLLKSWDNSKFYREANQLLGEVAEASIVLEDPLRKAEYDRDLRRRLGLPDPPGHANGVTPTVPADRPGFVRRRATTTVEPPAQPRNQPVRSPSPTDDVATEQAEVVEEEEAGPNYDRMFLRIAGGLIVVALLAAFWVFRKPAPALVDESQPVPIVTVAEPPPPPLPPPHLALPFTAEEAREAQETWAKSLGKKVVETNSLGMEFVLIPPGSFQMGSPADEVGRIVGEDQVSVTLTDPMWMGKTEVTQGQWEQVMGTTPWQGMTYVMTGSDCAASYISWDDAQAFARKLSQRDGISYRLPTEAEWEWSCRAGTTTPWSFGGNEADLTNYAWFGGALGGNASTERYAHQVALKLGNPFGLHDMHGNVIEWCEDALGTQRGGTNPKLTSFRGLRVWRGGSFLSDSKSARCAIRTGNSPFFRHSSTGFRVLMQDGQPTPTVSSEQANAINVKEPNTAGPTAPSDLPPEPPSQPKPDLPRLTIPFSITAAQGAQEAWAKSLGKQVVETNKRGMEFVLIPPGTFQMGSPITEVGRGKEEGEQVNVTLTDPIWLGKYEVTQGQWIQVMGTMPWKGKDNVKEGPNYAASHLSWIDAEEFVKRLSQQDSATYRLPTEAEWEWSCRAGTASRWSFGEIETDLPNYAWYGYAKNQQFAHQGGLKLANPFGLHDMYGNVGEWCEDLFVARLPGGTNPNVVAGGVLRVLRGGSWDLGSRLARSASRMGGKTDFRDYNTGLRIVLVETGPIASGVTPPGSPPSPKPPGPFLKIPFTAAQAKEAQTAWAQSLGKKVVEANGLGMEFVLIPPGKFQMGSPASEVGRQADENQVDQALTEPIWLGKTEVTQGQWERVMGSKPWRDQAYVKDGSNYPATWVNWSDVQEFAKKLSLLDGTTYRLPTEAEWEWSCRAGTVSRWSFGENESEFTRYGWCLGNTRTEPYAHAAVKLANPFGLHDMHGNVCEWCDDVPDAKLPAGPNQKATAGNNHRTLRGGDLVSDPQALDSAFRIRIESSFRGSYSGFRILMTGQPASR